MAGLRATTAAPSRTLSRKRDALAENREKEAEGERERERKREKGERKIKSARSTHRARRYGAVKSEEKPGH